MADQSEVIRRLARRKKAAALRREEQEKENQSGIPAWMEKLPENERRRAIMVQKANQKKKNRSY